MGDGAIWIWRAFTEWVENNSVGDVASLAGVCISLIGFAVTLWNVRRSRTAAQRAEEAARETRRSIRILESVYDFGAAISTLEEIKRLHREEAWSILPDRYADLRKRLIALRSHNPDLTEHESEIIQRATQHLRDTEGLIERANFSKEQPEDVAHINAIISHNIDDLYQLFVNLKARM